MVSSRGICDIYPELDESAADTDFSNLYKSTELKKAQSFSETYKDAESLGKVQKASYLDSVSLEYPNDIEEAYFLNQKYETSSKYIYSFQLYTSDLFSPVESNIFKTIFKNKNSSSYGPFYLECDSSFKDKKHVHGLGYHLGFGMGYFQGKALSVGTSEETKTRLTLWFLPVDLGLTYRVLIKDTIGLKFSAGGTISGMIQSRSDFRDNEKGKNVNRLGQGFYALGRVDILLGRLMTKTRKVFFHNYGFSNLRLNLDMKYQSLSFNGEANELDFQGSSVGIGVSFDVL